MSFSSLYPSSCNISPAYLAAIEAANKPSSSSSSVAPARLSTGTAGTVASYDDDDDEEDDEDSVNIPYWEDEDWVPTMKSGKQRTPNQIRNELQKFIDTCKATKTCTQGSIVQEMGVSNNSFRKFMNPKTYKDQWSATQNGTYWAAAKLLEKRRNKPKPKKKKTTAGQKKRSRDENDNGGLMIPVAIKKSKSEAKTDVLNLYERVGQVEGVNERSVHDSCPEIVKKVNFYVCMCVGGLQPRLAFFLLSMNGMRYCISMRLKVFYVLLLTFSCAALLKYQY